MKRDCSRIQFQASDFTAFAMGLAPVAEAIATHANEVLAQRLAACPEVFGVVVDETKGPQWTVWRTAKDTPDPFDRKDTHRARLVNVESLAPEGSDSEGEE